MATMVYDESYGQLSYALRAAIRKFNVSPSDYSDLQSVFGYSAYGAMTAAIKLIAGKNNGFYNPTYSQLVAVRDAR